MLRGESIEVTLKRAILARYKPVREWFFLPFGESWGWGAKFRKGVFTHVVFAGINGGFYFVGGFRLKRGGGFFPPPKLVGFGGGPPGIFFFLPGKYILYTRGVRFVDEGPF